MNPKQTWAQDPESGAGYEGHPTTAGDSRPYADTNRDPKGDWQKPPTPPIQKPQNLVADPVWGVNDFAGGKNTPESPEIPVTKGQ